MHIGEDRIAVPISVLQLRVKIVGLPEMILPLKLKDLGLQGKPHLQCWLGVNYQWVAQAKDMATHLL